MDGTLLWSHVGWTNDSICIFPVKLSPVSFLCFGFYCQTREYDSLHQLELQFCGSPWKVKFRETLMVFKIMQFQIYMYKTCIKLSLFQDSLAQTIQIHVHNPFIKNSVARNLSQGRGDLTCRFRVMWTQGGLIRPLGGSREGLQEEVRQLVDAPLSIPLLPWKQGIDPSGLFQ